ncbi:MAG: Uma2 family endonuclease [Armatimonadetes bacterium]|nr:Uma2 family endonuclease [Armatimonadota bacterium]MDW8029368.1 Uma2 family endonuclease [Armatimonadota bacterium]
MVNTAVALEVLEEKMPESPWHSEKVDELKELLKEVVKSFPEARIIRDIFFEFGGKRYAPDIAIILRGSPPLERIGMIYRVPEDGPAPDVIVEVAVSAKSLGEALSEKARFYSAMGVKDYLVVEAQLGELIQLWWCKPMESVRPKPVVEVMLESLNVVLKVEGQKIIAFDNEGKPILPPAELAKVLASALEQERAKREELERKLTELQAKLKQP